MHRIARVKLSAACLLFVVMLTAAFLEFRVSTPGDNWSKVVTTRSPNGRTTGYQMMVYVDRPVVRPGETCRTYLRIKNAGKYPLELTHTYLTNHDYVNGELIGEEIGDWEMPDAPVRLLPGEVRDVLYSNGIRIRYPDTITIGTRGFQFQGFGLSTNTVTVYILPSRPVCLLLAALGALILWRAWLGFRNEQRSRRQESL